MAKVLSGKTKSWFDAWREARTKRLQTHPHIRNPPTPPYASNVLGHCVLVAGYYADKSKTSNGIVVACSSVHWKYGRGNRTKTSCELEFDTKDHHVFHLVKFTDDTGILRWVDLSNSGEKPLAWEFAINADT